MTTRLISALLMMPVLLLVGSLPAAPPPKEAGTQLPNVEALSENELESRLSSIDASLQQLARFSLRSGIGAIGYRSLAHPDATHLEWLEITLDQAYRIDEIALVPTISRNNETGFAADAFPAEFRIIVGTTTDRIGRVVAEYHANSRLLPRIAPLMVPIDGVIASWVRIEATLLSPRSFDQRFDFQLAEVLVFSGTEDVALHRPVTTSSNFPDNAGAWDQRFLVDGFTPYLMDSAQGKQSQAFVSRAGNKPVLQLDLGKPYALSRIHLHTIDQSDTVPQAYAGDLGLPHQLRIEGANQPDFSDAKLLLDYRQQNINETGPIMMWRIPETTCRYIRLSEAEPGPSEETNSSMFRIGFAEIELFAQGINVALGKPAKSSSDVSLNRRRLSSLTDGNNLYGQILPIRTWLNELSRRHDLEVIRPLIVAELSHRYAQQKTNLRRMSWLAGALATGIFLTVLTARYLRMRDAMRIKERFAADLHDELGADLHAIGILSDLAKDAVDSREEQLELLDQVRLFTERSGIAARNCTNMLEAEGICEDLVDEMTRTARRLLTDLEHHISFFGEAALKSLKPRRRIDIFFFYKECLTNILRHSGATKITTQMTVVENRIELIITDNGQGLPGTAGSTPVPPSLKRRARILGASVSARIPSDGGTRICLKLKIRRFSLFS